MPEKTANGKTWVHSRAHNFFPQPRSQSITEWGRQYLRLPGSARSEAYKPEITPWCVAPAEALVDRGVKIVTFVKPIQSGGSTVGELAVCYWIASESGGDIQWNWQHDDNAHARWDKRLKKILKVCEPVQERWPTDRHDAQKGLVVFPHLNLMVQGSFAKGNLDSDSIRFQCNEEIHNWEPGKLDQAYERTTAFWEAKILNISNAGVKGDQLHKAFEAGTAQWWEVQCPGCGEYHRMHTKLHKDGSPGGLRYDADGCRDGDGSYDYNKLEPTIFYEFECGARVHDDPLERRRLSLSGRYGAPTNRGAHLSNRSFTLDAVAVDYIPWISLIEQKHKARRALRLGDIEPWIKYLQHRECLFYDPEDRPLAGRIVLSADLKKDRAGLADRKLRGMAVDRQQGSLEKGELPHWWVVIRDFNERESLLVYEGKILTDEDVVDVQRRHDVLPRHVVVDSGDDTTHVYRFCLQHGYNAIKGHTSNFFSHEEGDRRIWSVEKPLHAMLGAPPTQESLIDEPMFFFYSKTGIRDRLSFLRASGFYQWKVPSDVSEDYKAHMESEELQTRRHPRTQEVIKEYIQLRERNDLYVCECYLALEAEQAGLIGNYETEQAVAKASGGDNWR